jgi:hypothetical protein
MRAVLLSLCFLALGVWSSEVLDPTDGLTKPLIVDPNQLSEADAANVASVAQVLANEPESAKASPPSADEDALAGLLDAGTGGSTDAPTDGSNAAAGGTGSDSSTDSPDSSNPAAEASAIEKEIKLLTSLVEHGKAIAKALPEKEQRLKELAAQLAAANGKQQAAGAEAQLAEQKLLLAQIELKVSAMKKKLEDLETTHTKLQASISKVESAVNTNDAVNHQLNQEAAAASVGGEASTGGAAAPAAFLDKAAIEAVTRQAKAALRGDGASFTKKFQNLFL